jgi:hypothetical protein
MDTPIAAVEAIPVETQVFTQPAPTAKMIPDDGGEPIAAGTPPPEPQATPEAPKAQEPKKDIGWKSNLDPDSKGSPTMSKFPDTVEGLNAAIKSHLELVKMLGHDKIPVPKGPDDVAAMNLYKKAFGIPEEAKGYALPDADLPESMQGMALDKEKFQEVIHKYNLTPEQAKGVWKEYIDTQKNVYQKYTTDYTQKITDGVNENRQHWGEAYDSKVELGQMVINKFSESKEDNDFITSALVSDPRGVRWLAKIGEQFAESKIGDFKYQRHSLSPTEARAEIQAIKNDPNHPYSNEKASPQEHEAAMDYVNSLYAAIGKAETRR